MAAEIFYVRLFIYGLVGFVQGPGQTTTVLLPSQDQHEAFVAFNDGTCTPQCKVRIGPNNVNGFPLTGNEIHWAVDQAANPGHQRQPRPPIIGSLPSTFDVTLPIAPLDSAAFDWVAPMVQIVGAGTVDKDCMQGPSSTSCNKPKGLAGRTVLETGVLSTCKLIETGKCESGGTGEVHTFTFQPTAAEPQVEQALAEIEVAVTRVSGSSLTLTLTKLGDPKAVQQVVLKPAACPDGDPKTKPQCVDIFIGNMLRSNDCKQVSGDHFAALYALLAPGFTGAPPIPFQDTGHWVPASDVQPLCVDVPSGPGAVKGFKDLTPAESRALAELRDLKRLTVADLDRARRFNNYLLHFYPNQRAICPMAAFNPPS